MLRSCPRQSANQIPIDSGEYVISLHLYPLQYHATSAADNGERTRTHAGSIREVATQAVQMILSVPNTRVAQDVSKTSGFGTVVDYLLMSCLVRVGRIA